MENAANTFLPLLISLSLLSFAPILSGADQIGVPYGRQMSQPINPQDLISCMQFNNIGKIRFFDDDVFQALNGTKIEASIPHSVIDVIHIPSWSRPSSAEFAFDKKDFMKSMLELLNNTKAPFMANMYPYFLRATDSVSTEFALVTQDTPSNDNGLLYNNAFDAMHDSVVAAMAKLGFHDIPNVVTETAWPSDGQEGVANVENAGVYVNNLIKHVTAGLGTPARKGINVPTYYFTIFDEDAKDGPLIWKNVGMFKTDTSSKYYLDTRPLGLVWCECGQECDSVY